MIKVFKTVPSFEKYSLGGDGNRFKNLHWQGEMYGGPVTDGVYTCDPDKGSDGCFKPNRL